MKGFIYKVTCTITGKVYIGQTIRSIEERWTEHTRNAIHNDNLEYKNKFHRALRKYGINKFIVKEQEVFEAETLEALQKLLNAAETKWIIFYDSKTIGYNSTLGGDYNPMYGIRGKDNPCSRKINQYDLEGHFIKTWDAVADIKRAYGTESNVVKVCSSKRLEYKKVTALKSVWRYYDEYPDCKDIIITEEELEIRNNKRKNVSSFKLGHPVYEKAMLKRSKKVDQYTLDGVFIKTYKSVHEAGREVDCPWTTILSALKRENNVARNFRWKFHE